MYLDDKAVQCFPCVWR